jgi:hypothetical protein
MPLLFQLQFVHVDLVQSIIPNLLATYFSSWQNDVFVVAEPGELADKFVQSVKLSLLSMMRRRRRKEGSLLTNITTVSDLVAFRPYFQIGCIVHRYIGRQTQVCAIYFSLLMFSFVISRNFQTTKYGLIGGHIF